MVKCISSGTTIIEYLGKDLIIEYHPFKVLDDARMDDLVESIKQNGVLSPVLIRPRAEGGYEMISGHRRLHASEKAGLDTIPAIIKEMSDDEAVIAMVDSNVQREEILPSERAWSFKMKMDAMSHQGVRTDLQEKEDDTSATEWPKLTVERIGKESGLKKTQVKKYIRLTELIPEILALVDEKHISIKMGVDISYFDKETQEWIIQYRKENGILLQDQIDALKELKNIENITKYTFTATMNNALPEKKVNGKVTLSEKKLNRYFPVRMTSAERERIIIGLLEDWKESRA